MLQEGRLPLNDAEYAAVDALIEANPGAAISLTRRDENETGPLLVHVGETTFEVAEDGAASELA